MRNINKLALILGLAWLGSQAAKAQPFVDCTCLATQSVLMTNACQAVIPDMCLFTNCYASTVVPPPVITCSQTPPAGGIVGPGTYPIIVTISDPFGTASTCAMSFVVTGPSGTAFSLICPTNKIVECGSGWTFDPPTWTNACCAPAGVPNGGVILTALTPVTNGLCPQFITQTWQAVDFCKATATCKQTVKVVDTTPPFLDCNCLANAAVNPFAVPLSVTACATNIPDLCPAALFCATDNCGPLTCSQSPTAGTSVGPGNYPITVTVTDCAGNIASCVVNFTVNAPPGGCTTNPCVPPPPGMVAWWPLDELTGAPVFADATGNGNTALVESFGPVGNAGSPTAVAGKVAGANYFYGLSPRGRALNVPMLNFGTGDFSVDCWANPVLTGSAFWHPIVDKLNQTSPITGFGYAVGLLNTKVVLKVGDGFLYTYTSVNSVSYGAWNFVAVMVDRTANTVTFHVNGVTEAPQLLSPAASFNSTVDLLIGSTYNGALPLGELAVDELELFNRTLTSSELNTLWSADSLGKCKTNSCLVSIFCPSNITITASCNQTCTNVTYPAPAVGNGILVGCNPPPGFCFPIGSTTVACTAANACGQAVTCGFQVTVNLPTNCIPCGLQTNIWNTGMGGVSGNVLLGPGVSDPNYSLVSQPAGGCTGPAQVINTNTIPAPPWLGTGPNSQWIGAGPTADCQAGVYHYRLCFNLPCTNGAAILGQWTADDWAKMLLNGQPTGYTIPSTQLPGNSFDVLHPVSITNGFLCGLNCLDFYVTNAYTFDNPTGFRAELTNIFSTCCTCTNTNCVVSMICPTNMTVVTCNHQAIVTYPAPTVSGNCSSTITVVCTPPSGSSFPLGPTVVTCIATDASGAPVGSCGFTVTVTPYTPGYDFLPVGISGALGQFTSQNGNGFITAQTAGGPLLSANNTVYPSQFPNLFSASGPVQGYLAQADFNATYSVTFDLQNYALSPSTVFGIWSVTEETDLYEIEVFDCNNNKIAPPFSSFFNFLGWDDDAASGNIGWFHMTLNPTTGRLSTSQFKSSGIDSDAAFWDNIPPNACRIVVTGHLGPSDGVVYYFAERRTCLGIKCPANITASICGTSGMVTYPAPVVFGATAPGATFGCNPPSSSVFPLGPTLVTCIATNAVGNTASCSFTVTLLPDKTPPVIDCACVQTQAKLTVQACTALIPDLCKLSNCFSDNCSTTLNCSQSPAAGTPVGPGAHPITITVTDAAGNSAQCTVTFTVIAPTQTRVWNTGMGGVSGNVPLAPATADPNFVLVSYPAGGCPGPAQVISPAGIPGAWVPNSTLSQWIGPAAFVASCPSGVYRYQLRFDLPCTNGASISGRYASDDLSTIYLNGVPTGVPIANFPAFVPVSITSGFVPGVNVLDIYVTNGVIWTGLRTELTNTFTCCCPGAVTIQCPPDRVLLTCSNSAVGYYAASATGNNGPIICTPPSGSNFPVGTSTIVTCTANNACGISASCSFAITVRPIRTRWLCHWMAIGIDATELGQAHLTARPSLGSSGQDGVSIDNLGSSGQDGARFELGAAQKFTFSTELDFTAPEGTRVDLALPPDPANPNGTMLLSFRSKGKKGYCVKSSTRYFDDPQAELRTTAVGTNGDLFSSFTESANLDTYVPLNINYQPGVTSVVVTVTLDCFTGEMTLEFPHCIWTPDFARKGWDGCIYGNYPRRSTQTARLTLTPVTTLVFPPTTALDLLAVGVESLDFEDPSITASGRKWGDGHVTLMKAFDDGLEEGVEFTSFGDGGGVHVDLGHTETFDFKLTKFETGDVPTQDDLLTRTIGPIRGLTNRPPPPPPVLDALLLSGPLDAVECSADFTGLSSPTVHVLIYNQGTLVAERSGVPAQLGQPLFTLPEWPSSLGKLSGASPCRRGTIKLGTIRLPGSGAAPFVPGALAGEELVIGDEFRVLAEMPPGAPHPDYYSAFEFIPSDGPTWQVSNLQRTLACPPATATVTLGPDGLLITWPSENSRLQGSENVNGPWFDLGVTSPVSLAPGYSARFFRLVCD